MTDEQARTGSPVSAASAGYTAADRDAAEAGDGRGGGGPDARGKYRCILADPPWPYESSANPWLSASPTHRPNSWDRTTGGPFSEPRYGCMSMEDLKALRVEEHAADDAHLYLWTTNAFMVEAHELAEAWGFKPKTIITWTKTRHEDGQPSMKTGYYFRGATEHILFCVRGSLRLQGPPAPTAILHPRLPHSAKPGVAYSMIEEQSPGPRLEIFARPVSPLFPKRPGWHTWGNEMPNDVDLAPKSAGNPGHRHDAPPMRAAV